MHVSKIQCLEIVINSYNRKYSIKYEMYTYDSSDITSQTQTEAFIFINFMPVLMDIYSMHSTTDPS